MQRYRIVLKTGLLICYIMVTLFSFAQQHDFRFFPVKDMTLTSHGFINKIGSRFFLLNRANPGSLGLYIYDTVSKTGADFSYQFPKQLRAVMLFEKSLAFIATTADSAGMACHFIEVGEKGEVLRAKKHILPIANLPFQAIVSDNQKHTLFYQNMQRGADSAHFYGFMIGLDGEIEKQLSYGFKYDKERDLAPKTFLDNEGNIHVLVFDQYNNYRLSSNLTINSIPFWDNEIVSEAFMLEKTKLKTMQLFQNEQCNCIQAEGMYADGIEKDMQGLYRIKFPVDRKNELSTRLFPFDKEMIKNFKKGFPLSEKIARNSLQLQDIHYSDSGSFAVMRLNAPLGSNIILGPRSESPLVTNAKSWNAPKLIFIKLGKEEYIEWYTIKALDVFRSSMSAYFNDITSRIMPVNYNSYILIGGEKQETAVVLYEADAKEKARPVFISIRNGKQTVEKIPEQKLAFSSILFLQPNQYASLYANMENGEAGILFIQKKG